MATCRHRRRVAPVADLEELEAVRLLGRIVRIWCKKGHRRMQQRRQQLQQWLAGVVEAVEDFNWPTVEDDINVNFHLTHT